MNTKRFGFTLIELLTVIAIIGILAAILIPVASRIRDEARAAQCKSNQRESGVGLLLMANDDEGRLAVVRQGNGYGRWGQHILDDGYIDSGSRAVLYCPSWDPIDYYIPAWDYRTYGFNMIQSRYTQIYRDTGPEMFVINTEKIEDPSRYFILADSYYPGNRNQRFRISDYRASDLDGLHLRHNGKLNMFFLDGHVETVDSLGLAVIGFRTVYGENEKIINLPRPPTIR